MHQRGVDHGASLGIVEKVVQVTQVSSAAAHTVTSAVFVQHKHLAWAKPTLHAANTPTLLKGELNVDKKWQSDDLFYITMNKIRRRVDQF